MCLFRKRPEKRADAAVRGRRQQPALRRSVQRRGSQGHLPADLQRSRLLRRIRRLLSLRASRKRSRAARDRYGGDLLGGAGRAALASKLFPKILPLRAVSASARSQDGAQDPLSKSVGGGRG